MEVQSTGGKEGCRKEAMMYERPRNRKRAEVNRPEAHVAYFSSSPLNDRQQYKNIFRYFFIKG
jgi:hypothetical protein